MHDERPAPGKDGEGRGSAATLADFKPGDRVEVLEPWGPDKNLPGPGTVAKVTGQRVTVNWDSRAKYKFTRNKGHYKPGTLRKVATDVGFSRIQRDRPTGRGRSPIQASQNHKPAGPAQAVETGRVMGGRFAVPE